MHLRPPRPWRTCSVRPSRGARKSSWQGSPPRDRRPCTSASEGPRRNRRHAGGCPRGSMPEGSGLLSASHPSFLFALTVMLLEEWLDEPVEASPRAYDRPPPPMAPQPERLRRRQPPVLERIPTARTISRSWRGWDSRMSPSTGWASPSVRIGSARRPVLLVLRLQSGPRPVRRAVLLRGVLPSGLPAGESAALEQNAALARRYGLVPGLHINSPRSMPEEFWARYGFLRGARVDHPRETFRPRYTLAMAHPAVQEHYRELIAGRPARGPGPRVHPRLDERQRVGIRVRQLALRREERGTISYPRVEGQRRDRADGGGKRPDLLPAAPGRGPRGESGVPAGLRPGPVLRRTEVHDPGPGRRDRCRGVRLLRTGDHPRGRRGSGRRGAHGAT